MSRVKDSSLSWFREDEDLLESNPLDVLQQLEPKREGWYSYSYITDYVLTGLCFVLVGVMYFWVPLFQRYLPSDEAQVEAMYPYPELPNIVPPWSLALICLVGPLLIFLAPQFWRRSAHDFHNSVLGLLQALALTLLTTEALKLAAGEYRPDYYAIVQQPSSSTHDINDGHQSFPSGHASTSFAAMSYVSLWLAANLGVFAKQSSGDMWRAIISLVPLTISFFVAISRVDDYHHNFTDITAGAIIGAAFALYCWHLNYPSLFSRAPHVPKLRPPKLTPDMSAHSDPEDDLL